MPDALPSIRLRPSRRRLLARLRLGDRDIVLVASTETPRLRRLTVYLRPDQPGAHPPELLPAA